MTDKLEEGKCQKGVNNAPVTPRPYGSPGGQGIVDDPRSNKVIQMISHNNALHILMDSGKIYYQHIWTEAFGATWTELKLPNETK